MAQTLLTPTIVAKEALIALENNMVLGGLVHRAYSKEYKSVGATIQVRKPTSFTATAVATTSTIAVQEASEATVNVALDALMDVSFEVGSQELAVDVVSFSEQFIQPAMRAHAQALDSSIAALYANIAGFYEANSTPAVADIAGVRSVLNVNKAPMTDRRLVMHPMTEASYIALDSFLHASKRGDGGKALRSAEMGKVMGFDCYMDQNIQTHVSNEDGTALVNGACTVGAAEIGFDAAYQAAGTLIAGDVVHVVGNDQWMLATGGTFASSAGTIAFTPALAATITDNDVMELIGGHRTNLAFHKNAFALVTAPLQPPMGGAKGTTVSYKGLTCRVVYDYNITNKKNQVSLDMLWGVTTLDQKLAARLADCRNL